MPQVIFGHSDKSDGNMALHVGDGEGAVTLNRGRFLAKFGLDIKNLICLDQTHSSNIVFASKKMAGLGSTTHSNTITSTDAIITNEHGLILSVMTADCVPVVLYDSTKGIVAAIHAGWRGTASGIVQKTAQKMINDFECEAKNIKAEIFPSIGECCYEVGDETANLCGCGGKKRLDLQSINCEKLLSIGVIDTNIMIDKTCTACGGKWLFSYRAENGKCGRFMSFIVIKS